MRPAVLAGSYVLAGVGLWRGLSAFSQQVPVLPGLGLAFLTASAGLAASHLAVYAERRKLGGVFSGLFRWLAENRLRVAILALTAGLYVFVVRPAYMGKSAYSVLIEWMIVLVSAILVLGIARFRIGRRLDEVAEVAIPDWRRHQQRVGPKTDSDYAHLRGLERRFVEEADQTMLIHFLMTLLALNEVGESDAATALTPLIEYRGQRGHGREAKRQGEKERGQLLKAVVAGMQSTVQPSRYSMYQRLAARTPDSPGNGEEPQALSKLVDVFCNEGDGRRLMVRLSSMLAASGTRAEDIDDVLRPLVTYHPGPHAGQRERERLWSDLAATAARCAPRIHLKEAT